MMNDINLVSIIVPVYNAEEYLDYTINSVLNQTYQNFELLLVDDCSTDKSKKIYNKYKEDKRVIWIEQTENCGAASARNRGVERAAGRYICYIDADDLWKKEKLEKQIEFMEKSGCTFSFTGYEFADANGKPLGTIVNVPKKINYKQALKNTTIFTSTVMFDMNKISKEDIYMPNVRRGQDTATWWNVLKKIDFAYGLDEVLAIYRRTSNSLSANKIQALKRTWYLYRNIEKISFFKSLYYFCWYCFNAVKRRI